MCKKKKALIVLFCIAVVFISFKTFVPQYYFDEDIEIDITAVHTVDHVGMHTDITKDVDIEHLEHVLHLMQCSRTKNSIGYHKLGEIAYYIFLNYDNVYYQISLTDTDVYQIWNTYTASGHKIKNGDVWFNIMYGLTY